MSPETLHCCCSGMRRSCCGSTRDADDFGSAAAFSDAVHHLRKRRHESYMIDTGLGLPWTGRFVGRNPHFAAMPSVAKLLWPLLILNGVTSHIQSVPEKNAQSFTHDIFGTIRLKMKIFAPNNSIRTLAILQTNVSDLVELSKLAT